jgi:hypothetical protein
LGGARSSVGGRVSAFGSATADPGVWTAAAGAANRHAAAAAAAAAAASPLSLRL